MSDLSILFGSFLVVGILILAVAILAYVLTAVWCKEILKALDYKNPNYAWIPVVNMIVLALAIHAQKETSSMILVKKDLPCFIYDYQVLVVAAVNYLLSLINLSSISGILVTVINILLFGTIYRDGMELFGKTKKDTECILPGWISIIGLFLLYKEAKEVNKTK